MVSKTATKKKPKVVKEDKEPKEDKQPKSKSLFDHLDAIYVGRNPDYFKTLSASDKKTWSNYMITRFISMNPAQIDITNYIQKFSSLPPEMLYRFYVDMIVRGRQYSKYVKNSVPRIAIIR